MQSWTQAFPLSSIPRNESKLFRREKAQIAIWRLEDEVFAVDNRCPHEGYPLIQGAVCEHVLTCSFHNFKFDLRDGNCLVGDEDVRSYRTRIVEGMIEVDLAPEDPIVALSKRWKSLREGLLDGRMGQVARDVVRLRDLGVSRADIALAAAEFDARHAQYGTTHALPTAADCLHWPGILPLVQAMDVASEPNVRRPARERLEPMDPGPRTTFSDRLCSLVEAEDAMEAEALIRGAVLMGWEREVLDKALLDLCCAHFLDFGHALIYVNKAFELFAQLEDRHDEARATILGALVYRITFATREDVLPAWKGWRNRLAAATPGFGRWNTNNGPVDASALRSKLLYGSGPQATGALVDALNAGSSPDAIAKVLCVAGAERFFSFDPEIDLRMDVQDNWLSVTHIQTFCNAVRHALPRLQRPGRLRLLFQAARMIQHHGVLDSLERTPIEPQSGDLRRAIANQDASTAIGIAASQLSENAPLQDTLCKLVIDDPFTRPIFIAHGIKQTVAAFDDYRATSDPICVLALVRFLASPKRERRIARLSGEAERFVRTGAVPKLLAP